MNKLLLTLSLLLPLSLGAETFNYGFCPEDATEEEQTALGSGKNNGIEVMIRLSPAEMPQVAALKGSKITGMRAKLRNDVEAQARIIARQGSLDAEPISKNCYLDKGWNTVKFATPIEIGEEDIYIGYRVNETQGTSGSHPVLACKVPSPSGTSFINVALTGWQDAGTKGSVMLQAIIDGDASVLDAPAATATVYDFPQLVAPSAPFDATVSVKNLSSRPISSLTVDYGYGKAELSAEIAPFGVAQIPATLMTSQEENTDFPFVTSVSDINGTETAGYCSTAHLYVTKDVFTRIPLIEEWTGQTCKNCPFMAYYVDDARELFGKPHTYVAHHAGFAPDKLTQPVDEQLTFLFNGNMRNPAIMYDRSYLPGETEIVLGAKEPSPDEYINCLVAAQNIPALAEVNVSVNEKEVTVSGKVSTGSKTSDGKVYISAYLIEDNIKPTADNYPQLGINADVNPDAPADLVEKFRHHGVIRANLTTVDTGDKLEYDGEGYYEVKFTLPEFDSKWNPCNMHVVSFIHRFDPANLTDNYVLNSGDSKPIEESSLREISAKAGSLNAVRGLDGKIVILTPIQSAEAFNAVGQKIDLRQAQPSGLYIIRALLPDGSRATSKIRI